MKKYLVSGIGVSDGGVGRLMRKLIVQAAAEEFSVIVRRNPQPIGRMLKHKMYLRVAAEVLSRLVDSARFAWRVRSIDGAVVVFVHPQTAGFSRFINVVRKNKVYLYVMDNSFFCMRSYNLHPELEAECLKCLSGPRNAMPTCQPFPVKVRREENIDFLEEFERLSSKLIFLTQNSSQAQLIRARFGAGTQTRVVGLDTGEIASVKHSEFEVADVLMPSYDLVFHGAPQLAKGIRYFVELAESLSEFSALIPSSREQCELTLGRKINAANITFKECTWETGLKCAIQKGHLVVNPSLWSAPIEGALQKSMHFAPRVAVVESEFGYEKEFEQSSSFIRLPRDIQAASDLLRQYFPGAVFESVQKEEVNIPSRECINVFEMVMSNEV